MKHDIGHKVNKFFHPSSLFSYISFFLFCNVLRSDHMIRSENNMSHHDCITGTVKETEFRSLKCWDETLSDSYQKFCKSIYDDAEDALAGRIGPVHIDRRE